MNAMDDNSTAQPIAPRSQVSKEKREEKQNHRGMVFWLTGMSGAGKSTLAPDCVINTEDASEADCADALIRFIKRHSRFRSSPPPRDHRATAS